MRDSHATAIPADMPVRSDTDGPDTVLPYDPDDWDRRLAEARMRRAAVLQARAATSADAAPPVSLVGLVGATRGPRPAQVPPARPDDGVPRGGPTGPDPEAWRRRLAEARGLTPARDDATAPTPPVRRSAEQETPDPARGTVVAAETASDTAQGVQRVAPAHAVARGGSTLRVAALAGLAGLAAGVALAAVLVGQWPPATSAPASGAAQATSIALAGVPPVAIQAAAFVPPSLSAPFLGAHSAFVPPRGADMPARHAAPAMPAMPDTAPVALTLPPPDLPPATTANDATPFVVVHVPPVSASAERTDLMAESAARGWAVVPVGFTVSRSHLRVYHAADRPAATALGDRLGLPIRDFIDEIPAPQGLIEVWVAGGPSSEG